VAGADACDLQPGFGLEFSNRLEKSGAVCWYQCFYLIDSKGHGLARNIQMNKSEVMHRMMTRPGWQTWPLSWHFLSVMLIIVIGVFTKALAFSGWWCLDDWGELARSAGFLEPAAGFPARWVSQHFYWSLTWPVFGNQAHFHTAFRILVHCACAVLTYSLGKRWSIGEERSFLAAAIFAATPFAFTPVFWASGIQELLGAVLALLALFAWFHPGKARLVLVLLFGTLSMLSKESALGLPVVFALVLAAGRWRGQPGSRGDGITVLLLALVGTLEALLLKGHFATGPGSAYQLGGGLVVLGNLGKYGWWFLSQGPVFTGQVTWTLAGIGLGFLALLMVWSVIQARGDSFTSLFITFCLFLSLAPTLVLVNQVRPYMGYLAMAAVSLIVASAVPRSFVEKKGFRFLVFFLAMAWGFWGFSTRMHRSTPDGRPADPVVRASQKSRETVQVIKETLWALNPDEDRALVVYQPVLRPEAIQVAQREGPGHIMRTEIVRYLEGEAGLKVALKQQNVRWVNTLSGASAQSVVFCETQTGLKYWGNLRDALLYSAMLDVVVGNNERAWNQMTQACGMNRDFSTFAYDPSVLNVPGPSMRGALEGLLRWARASKGAQRSKQELECLRTLGVLVGGKGGITDHHPTLLNLFPRTPGTSPPPRAAPAPRRS
jgi:hypothetical protein